MSETMFLTMAIPRPVPAEAERPSMANGSNMCSQNAGSMPMPSSATTNVTVRQVTTVLGRTVAANRTCPPSGVYFAAFDSRFTNSWRRRTASPMNVSAMSPCTSTASIWPFSSHWALATSCR